MASGSTPMRDRASVVAEIALARNRLEALESELSLIDSTSSPPDPPKKDTRPMSLREYKRYGRQMLIKPIGLPGQLKLKHSHVLVVGAGGLGCPVLLYLAAGGIGEVTILDHDSVELSNLHRQVLHTEQRVGMSKAQSAKIALEAINSDIRVHAHQLPFIPSIFHSAETPASLTTRGTFDLILDCTDNPATRHFLNAYAVAMDVPLVSGGAVRADGTVGVYNLPLAPSPTSSSTFEERGPCYACLFPPAPSPEPTATPASKSLLEQDLELERQSLQGTGACADEGVLGVNCGIVGIGMAAESIKVILGIAKPTLHLFAPLSSSPYRTIKTRPRKETCPTCGTFSQNDPSKTTTPQSRWQKFLSSDNGVWQGWQDPLCSVPGIGERVSEGAEDRKDERIKVEQLKREFGVEPGMVLVDTRPETEFGIVNVEGSKNVPFAQLLKNPSLALRPTTSNEAATVKTVAFLCRRGNDSLLASRALRRWIADNKGQAEDDKVRIVDVIGGLTAYAKTEEGFPIY
ncbi:Uba4p [Sporobolomyces koalae]|uniref:Uba4p n=1 Tax=Sporobolomyces koalae TaxID=500713 RepID=UPI0031793CC2